MADRILDLTLVSARDLKNVNLIFKLHAYAVLSLSEGNLGTQFQQTPVDRHDKKNPTWNYTANFFIPADGESVDGNLSIHIRVRASRMLGVDWKIGEIYIPVKSLMPYGGSNGTQAAYFASYQLRKAGSRKPRGVINISYKLREQMETPPMSPTQEPIKLRERMETPPTSPTQEPIKKLHERLATPPTSQTQEPVKLHERLATPPMSQLQVPVRTYPLPRPTYAQPYVAPPVHGYGYSQQQPMQHGMPNHNDFGMGLGAGLLGGAIGGLLVGDMISNMGAYDAGYDAGVYDAGHDAGFDDARYDTGSDDARYDAGSDDAGGFDGGYDF